jgi:hypothetical protein
MRKLTAPSLIIVLFAFQRIESQPITQSIIYDAVTIMNAKYGVNGLLVPSANGFDLHDAITGHKFPDSIDANTGESIISLKRSQADSVFRNKLFSKDIVYTILKRNAGLDPSATESDVRRAYKDNPFINKFLDTLVVRDEVSLKTTSRFATDPTSGGIGGNILGNLVNGTADFLIKRARLIQ